MHTDNLDVGSGEDDCQEGETVEVNSEEEIEVKQPEGRMVKDNSSEPSSSTDRQAGGEGGGRVQPARAWTGGVFARPEVARHHGAHHTRAASVQEE